jgi:hypothetical protein
VWAERGKVPKAPPVFQNQIRQLHTQIAYILTLRMAELKKIHTLDAPFTDVTGREELHFVQDDISGGIFFYSQNY